jgi:cell division protein FtsX
MGATTAALLRAYWRTAALLAGTLAFALAAVLPVARLAGRLLVTPGPGADPGLTWLSPARSGDAARQEAVEQLCGLLGASALAVAAAAALTLTAIGAARGARRDHEVSVRRAVGASRRVLAGAFAAEGALIGGAGLVAGLMPAIVAVRVALAEWPGGTRPGPWLLPLAAAGGLTLLILLGALFPVVFARRRTVREPGDGTVPLRVPMLLLGSTLAVLGSGMLASREARSLANRPAGRDARGELLRLQAATTTPAEQSAALERLLATASRLPRVEAASLTSPGAVLGVGTVAKVRTDCGMCPDGGLPIRFHVESATHLYVSPDSFRALGVRVLEGRGITAADRWGAEPVAVVNRTLARRHFEGGRAIGRTMMVGDDNGAWYRVVGIVEDSRGPGLGTGRLPPYTVYLSILQHPVSVADLVVQGGGAPPALLDAIRHSPGIRAVGDAVRVRDAVRSDQAPLTWFGRGLALEGWAMLVVALAGVFSLMRIWVMSHAPEIGIRRAIGASRGRELARLLGRVALAGLGGVGLGLWIAPMLWDTLRTLMPGLRVWNGAVLLPVSAILLAAMLAGAWLPARGLLGRPPAGLVGVEED